MSKLICLGCFEYDSFVADIGSVEYDGDDNLSKHHLEIDQIRCVSCDSHDYARSEFADHNHLWVCDQCYNPFVVEASLTYVNSGEQEDYTVYRCSDCEGECNIVDAMENDKAKEGVLKRITEGSIDDNVVAKEIEILLA